MTGKQHRRSVLDRARRRAARAYAASHGITYTAAARLLRARNTPIGGSAGDFLSGADKHRAWLFAMREQRSFSRRLQDTRMAVEIPLGRAAHLVERFPPLRLREPAPIRELYAGEARQVTLGLLYALLCHETPRLLPPASELSWVAELGEETAVDYVCAGLDRAARLLLEDERFYLWSRFEAALLAGEVSADRTTRDAAVTLGRDFRTMIPRRSLDGARNILDALLAGAYGGYPPGAWVRLLAGPEKGRTATVVEVCWQQTGPPTHYRVRVDEAATMATTAIVLTVRPEDVTPHDRPAATVAAGR